MFKPNLYGQIRAAEGCMRVGEKCVKYLKRGWNRREGREKKNFKKGGEQAGSRGGYLIKGDWNPLTNYD